MSGAYFESAGCGREVHVFLERRELLVKRAGGNPAAILPLWWQPLRSGGTMPAVLSRFQWNDSTLPAPYTEGGIRGVALGPNRGLYAMLVAQIADKIAMSWDLDLDPLPPGGLGDFDGLPNAFAGEDLAEVSPPNGAAPSNIIQMTSEDPYKVNVLYVAPRRREVVEGRSPECYSDRGSWFWQPYLPACRETIGQTVNSFSFRYDGRAHSLDDENVADVLREAGLKDQLVVMILDPWATLNEQCRAALQQFDSSPPLNFAVLTLWSAADQQTSGNADDLEAGLRLAFPRSYSRSGNERFRRSSGDRQEFGATLESVLEHLTQAIIDQRTANSRIAGPRLQVFKLVPGQAA
jgi:FxsC-like protein